MPKERTEDRMKIWRLYLKGNQKISTPNLSEQELDAIALRIIQRDRAEGIGIPGWKGIEDSFEPWYPRYKKLVLHERAKKAVNARWKKKGEKENPS
jgi:hypothetical protein